MILTAYVDDVYPARLLDAGAVGYITKGISMEELIKAIRAVCNGDGYISPKIAQGLFLNGLQDSDSKLFDKLSDRELQVALMVAQGYKTVEISNQLDLSIKTINSYRYHIFEKLRVDGDVELTRLFISLGLINVLPPVTESIQT